jgi:hypothetical protein
MLQSALPCQGGVAHRILNVAVMQGAASPVRKIDPASVGTAGLVEQLKGEQERWDRRSARYAADQANDS